ncbi:hypothetical protein HanRHA438_Chr07g0326621 [Helianthus annuus]|nr:hypothetical protein HanIR_Chr07g0341571 [Helianthus annuus]KAJ0909909.1 hypothetical protein HanRHA438_Chr07g0326621 [Helianthus annuus]
MIRLKALVGEGYCYCFRRRDPTRNNYLVPYLFLYSVYGRMDVNEWCWLVRSEVGMVLGV